MTEKLAEGLAEGLVEALDRLARRPRVLVAVDFDGTLAPLVEDRDDARALPASTAALQRLAVAPQTVVAYVSGRTVADLRRLAQPPDGAALVGSHGAEQVLPAITGSGSGDEPAGPVESAEPAGLDDDRAGLLREVTAAVEAIAARHPGALVETKPTTAVLHTRRCSADVGERARAAALDGPGRWPGVHLTPGKEIVELAVTDVSKGVAVERLRQLLGISPGGTVYLGDDVTDERAFAVLDPDAGDVAVKVGDGDTAAAHRVATPHDVAILLTHLAATRTR